MRRFNLSEPGEILLISCYELGHQPAALAQPMGFLEAAGFRPAALDVAVEAFDGDRITAAHLIAISVPMHTALRLGADLIGRIRAINPSAHVTLYGLYASLNAEYLLAHGADSVIGGEYERPLVELAQALQSGRRPADAIGVSLRDRITEPYLERTSSFPVPSRAALPPLARYARVVDHRGERLAGYVEASRGCLHLCRHCPIVPVYEGRFFVVPEATVLDDIRRQVQDGATHITFGDPDFLNGPGHAIRLVRALHAEFPSVTFDVTTKIEHLLKHRDLLPELAAAGCLFVISAVESFNDTVLEHLQKGHTCADIEAALAFARDAGLTLRPSLVAFTPWTALEEYVDLFATIDRLDLIEAVDPVQYTVRLLVPPGSALLDDPLPHPITEFITELDQAGFQHRWAHPDARMDRLQRDVSALVEADAQAGAPIAETFHRLWMLAARAAGRPAPALTPRERRPAPRMTEPWFCCSEPTAEQHAAITTVASHP
ncbi:MAG TPA: CUAEP/CCAEP-tail radical SAM protein [Nitrospirales bacterium]|nr:CUAEP/CCAEP-tail radical SAM protein [Nitrospirales bacterium]